MDWDSVLEKNFFGWLTSLQGLYHDGFEITAMVSPPRSYWPSF
jgi:hypothetical protein